MKKNIVFLLIFITFLIHFLIITDLDSEFYLYAGEEDQCIWTGVDKIVAIGDIHGDYKNFVEILKRVGLIDEEHHWIGGKTHLVQIGDILDRGIEARRVFDLIMRLEEEAEAVGGKVHMLIGDHEEMNITGMAFRYPGYITVEQYVSFLSDDYRESREKEIRENFEKSSANEENTSLSFDAELKKFWINEWKSSNAGDVYFENFNKTYGKWVLRHNTVIKINDIVFVHGGINEKFSNWELEEINRRAREELDHYRLARKLKRPPFMDRLIVYQPDGPFWFRGLANEDEEYFRGDVEKILENLGAKYMVIGHSPKPDHIISRFEQRIWLIDTAISSSMTNGGNLSALIIEDGEFIPLSFKDEQSGKLNLNQSCCGFF